MSCVEVAVALVRNGKDFLPLFENELRKVAVDVNTTSLEFKAN